MVAPKNVCVRAKSESPEPFREPEGMMSIDLNNDDNGHSKTIPSPKKPKKLSLMILVCYLFGFVLLAVVSFIIAVVVHDGGRIFGIESHARTKTATPFTSQNYKEEKNEDYFITKFDELSRTNQDYELLTPDLIINIEDSYAETPVSKRFRKRLQESNILIDKYEVMKKCLKTKSEQDCCGVLFDTELIDIIEFCNVDDVFDLLSGIAKGFRFKRDAGFEPYFQEGYFSGPEFGMDHVQRLTQEFANHKSQLEANGESEILDRLSQDPNLNNYYFNYVKQKPWESYQHQPEEEQRIEIPLPTGPEFVYHFGEDPSQQFFEAGSVHPNNLLIQDDFLNEKVVLDHSNGLVDDRSNLPNFQQDQMSLNSQTTEKVIIESRILPEEEKQLFQVSDDAKIEGTTEFIKIEVTTKENQTKNVADKASHKGFDSKSEIGEIVKIGSEGRSVSIGLKDAQVNLTKTIGSSENTTDSSLDILGFSENPTTANGSEIDSSTETIIIESVENSTERSLKEERANEQDFRQKKINGFASASEDVQTSQQAVVNPCFYSPFVQGAYAYPYRVAAQADASQYLKILPGGSARMQQPIYVVNPPLYSFVPPQSPYVQTYSHSHYASYNPVQVSGPGGQFYMCNPIPAPSNNIANMPGVEVRSRSGATNLQEQLEVVGAALNPSNETRAAEPLNCPFGEQSCTDGSKCIKNHMICDNEINCDDGSDELFCSCKDRVGKLRICDGYFDCPNGEDELGCFGCSENEISCDDWSRFRPGTCVPLEQRCDNIKQCEVTGKDEEDCSILTDHIGTDKQFKVSNSVGFLHRNYKGKWYPTCFGTELWASEVCRVEAGPSTINPQSHMMVTKDSYNGKFINILPNNEVSLVDVCVKDRAAFVECPPLYCGLRMVVKNPYRPQEISTSAEDFLSNLERNFNLDENLSDGKARNSTELLGSSRIVGGRPSQPGAWPWVVSIYKNGIFHCGGVIVNEMWILTAAHCVARYWMYYYEIQAGMLRRFSYSPMQQSRWAVAAIAHEDYNKANLKNDIALMKLNAPIRYNRYVRPICLPSETTAGRHYSQGPAPGTICTTVGWGATIEHGTDPDHLREVNVPILKKCKHKEDEEGDEICAGLSEGGKDACQGDSGGPFMCRNPNNPSQWYLAGIVSHGEGCARPNEPGVYTKVSKYIAWITENTRSDLFIPRIPRQKCPGYVCKGIEKCLPKKRRCDKIVDCLLGDDEVDCDGTFGGLFKQAGFPSVLRDSQGKSQNRTSSASNLTSSTEVTTVDSLNRRTRSFVNNTGEEYFKCKLLLELIPISKRCNKEVDCEDGTDEKDCLCVDYIKTYNPEAICDGIIDCNDLSDEADCLKCNEDQFHCRLSKTCIPLAKKCDGTFDCDLKEDEWDCAALTDGQTLSLDRDIRPKLAMSGVITINRFGVWRPLCTNTSDDEATIATNACNLLGFEEYIEFHKYPLRDKPLNVTMEGFKRDDYTGATEELENMCSGLYVSCSNVSLDSSVHNVYQDNSASDVELYTSPWNAVIYSDGIYRCMGAILGPRWIVTSINCFEGTTRLQFHYVVALLGKGKANLAIPGPHEQIRRIVQSVRVAKTDVVLLRLEKDLVYNRYVKPTHINARRDQFHTEKCVAIGIEDNKAKYVLLKPLKHCPEGQRCFETKLRENCTTTEPWSGTIVCDSRNGWYPAAVFNESNGSCGLTPLKQYTSIKYLKYKIKNAMNEPLFEVAQPRCEGFRCELGKCIESKKVCDGFEDCRNGEDETGDLCYEKEMKCHQLNECTCLRHEMKCNNNKCVPKSAFCNRNNDCEDFEDEPDVCSCSAYLSITAPEKVCDGKVHCFDHSDEDPRICPCKSGATKCGNSGYCIPDDMLCDGIEDCPNGEDESDCIKFNPIDSKSANIGEVLSCTAGVWHSGCFSRNLTNFETEEICLKLGFTGKKSLQVPIPGLFSKEVVEGPRIDTFRVVWIHREQGNKLKLRLRSGLEPYLTFQPDKDCHRLFIECI